MKINDIKIRTKIISLSAILILLIVALSIFVYYRVNNIYQQSSKQIEIKKLVAELSQREIDHLKWLSNLSTDIDNGKNEIYVETNENLCKFGQFLNSDKKTKMLSDFPETVEKMREIETLHTKLHHSGKDIFNILKPFNENFDISLRNVEIAKLNWIQTTSTAILNKNTQLNAEANPELCSMGIWINSELLRKAKEQIPEIYTYLLEVNKWHIEIHQQFKRIKYALQDKNFTLASAIYNGKFQQAQKKLTANLENIKKISQKRIELKVEASNIFEIKSKTTAFQLQSLLAETQQLIENHTSNNNSISSLVEALRRNILIFAILGTILAFILGFYISQNIISKINKSIDFSLKISDGELYHKLNEDSQDELGILMQKLDVFRQKLSEIISNIKLGANSIDDAAQAISASSQQQSQSANEQSATTEELSSSMEEMAANIQQSSDNSAHSEKIAIESLEQLQNGSKQIYETIDAMKQIADKISIINDIAFQTNILALNAAVEASRAGEAGKGFAVVAQEVRNLAQNSKEASKEIEMVVKNGLHLADKTNEVLKKLLPKIENEAQLAKEIAASSKEQNASINQVNNSIQSLNQVVQQNAATSEELATSSEEMAAQAEQMKQLIQFFKLKA